MSTGIDGMTLEQYLALPDEGFRDEVSRGRLVREPQPNDRYGEVSVEIVVVLSEYLKSHPVGRLRVASGFQLSREPLTVRGPDVAFIRNERLADMKAEPFFEGAPDLAIEVVSPGAVHHPNGDVRMLRSTDTLEAPQLLPEFQVPVARFFV
jgi:Uma2 family endonuclease